jgi:hypothetical protein
MIAFRLAGLLVQVGSCHVACRKGPDVGRLRCSCDATLTAISPRSSVKPSLWITRRHVLR